MDRWVDELMYDGWMVDGWTGDGWVGRWMDVCVDGWMSGWRMDE